jgi:hypothetical protein
MKPMVVVAVLITLAAGVERLWAQAPSAQLPYPPSAQSTDSLLADLEGDTTAADSAAAHAGPPPLTKLDVVDRDFRYRRQVGMALGMMAFLALIFTTTQNWNPD